MVARNCHGPRFVHNIVGQVDQVVGVFLDEWVREVNLVSQDSPCALSAVKIQDLGPLSFASTKIPVAYYLG